MVQVTVTLQRSTPLDLPAYLQWPVWCLAFVLCLSGCGTPVGVRHVDIQTAYAIQTASTLSEERPSEPSKMVLRRLNLLDRFDQQPEAVIAELHHKLSPVNDEDLLFTLAELSFLHGQQKGDRDYFLASAIYAWALLFPDDGSNPGFEASDPRLRLTYDLYNQAVANSFRRGHSKGLDQDELNLVPGVRKLPFGTADITLDESGLNWGGYRLDRFIPTTTLEVRGFRNRYHTSGLGTPLAASLAAKHATGKTQGAERLGPRTKVPVTALLRFDHARASLTTGKAHAHLEIYAQDQTSFVKVNGREQRLESDPTAALAYQLEGSPLYAAELVGFLRGGITRGFLPRDRTQDGLFMLHPFKPGKIPIVLVHGTLSSPARWAELINELEGDPRIRERYQIWVFIYDSGNPIGYSASRLRAALTNLVKEFDPESKNPDLRRMVVIGHSQGGLLTKLTAVDSGNRFWNVVSSKPFESIKVDPKTRETLQSIAFYTPLPFVERVIFIATPHHGALLASGRLGAIFASLVTLPVGLFSRAAEAVSLGADARLMMTLRRPSTSIDLMNPDNPMLKTLSTIPVDPKIKASSIICVKGEGPKEAGDDGVVAYRSAHIPEAISELVVRSDHSCQGKPETIEEIRRILYDEAVIGANKHP